MNERLQQLIQELQAPQGVDWLQVRNRIFDEHTRADLVEDRATCLALFHTTADLFERHLESAGASDADVAKFKGTRSNDYSLFIVKESMTGNDVEPDKLNTVTEREVAAGRMKPNHRLRVLAIFSVRGLAPLLDEHAGLYDALTAGGE